MQNTICCILTTIFLFSSIFQIAYGAEVIQTRILNEDAERLIDANVHINLKEFNSKTKEVSYNILWDIEDKKTKESFQAYVRAYPFGGNFILNVNQDDGGYHGIWQEVGENSHPQRPNFIVNLWPFDQYFMELFLQFDEKVSLKIYEPLDTSSVGEMAEDPDWIIRVTSSESSFEEMQGIITGIRTDDEIQSVFKFQIILERSTDYIKNNIVYFILPFLPIPMIIFHIIRFKLSHQHNLTMFLGIMAISVTMFFGLYPILPAELTLSHLILIGEIISYPILFFKFVLDQNKKDSEEYPWIDKEK